MEHEKNQSCTPIFSHFKEPFFLCPTNFPPIKYFYSIPQLVIYTLRTYTLFFVTLKCLLIPWKTMRWATKFTSFLGKIMSDLALD